MLGVGDFWAKVAAQIPGDQTPKGVIDKLREIAERRNQIVHEADLIRRTKAKEITLRDLKDSVARDWVEWMKDLVHAIDRVVAAAL